VTGVASGKCGSVCDRDSGDEGISDINWLALALAFRGQVGGASSRLEVECQNAAFEIFVDHAVKPLRQSGLSTAIGQYSEPVARLEESDAGNENRF